MYPFRPGFSLGMCLGVGLQGSSIFSFLRNLQYVIVLCAFLSYEVTSVFTHMKTIDMAFTMKKSTGNPFLHALPFFSILLIFFLMICQNSLCTKEISLYQMASKFFLILYFYFFVIQSIFCFPEKVFIQLCVLIFSLMLLASCL